MTARDDARHDVDEDLRHDEFDQLAAWTADAIESIALDDPVPAACNGSGSPASLAWLGRGMGLGSGSLVVDTGAGLGGPAEWLARNSGATMVTSEPMIEAVRGSQRLFGRPGVVAWSHQLPFAGERFDGALVLAALSTVDDKAAYLAEVRRILRPGGRLGLLEYVRTAGELPDPPANNEFVAPAELDRTLTDSGFRITATVMSDELPSPPEPWTEAADRVRRIVAERHPGSKAVKEAEDQQARFSHLLSSGALGIRLVCADRP